MVTDNIVNSLKSLLETLSYGILIGCLVHLIFNYSKDDKKSNIVALAFMTSLSVIIITWDDLTMRIIFGYIILIGTAIFLAKEMRTKNKKSK